MHDSDMFQSWTDYQKVQELKDTLISCLNSSQRYVLRVLESLYEKQLINNYHTIQYLREEIRKHEQENN